jgi:hypothetical protein
MAKITVREPFIRPPLFGRFHDIAISRAFGFVTQPLVLPARPANDIDHAEYGRSGAEREFAVPPPIMRSVRYL